MGTLPFGSRNMTDTFMHCQASPTSPGKSSLLPTQDPANTALLPSYPRPPRGFHAVLLRSLDLSASQAHWSDSLCTPATNSYTGSPFLTSEQVFPEHKHPEQATQFQMKFHW